MTEPFDARVSGAMTQSLQRRPAYGDSASLTMAARLQGSTEIAYSRRSAYQTLRGKYILKFLFFGAITLP